MITTPDIQRPPKELIDALRNIGSATASGELARLGIRDPNIRGPLPRTPGAVVVGPALGFGANRVRSLPDGVAQVIAEYLSALPVHPESMSNEQMALPLADLVNHAHIGVSAA